MSEEKLQSEIAVEFSQRFPKKKGQLFHVSNERNHKIQAFKARAIGIYPGVADFIFISKKFNVATELKAPGSYHKREKIEQQVEWGKVWEREGNIWRLCITKKEALSCYKGKFKGLTIEQVENKLKSTKNKTIRF